MVRTAPVGRPSLNPEPLQDPIADTIDAIRAAWVWVSCCHICCGGSPAGGESCFGGGGIIWASWSVMLLIPSEWMAPICLYHVLCGCHLYHGPCMSIHAPSHPFCSPVLLSCWSYWCQGILALGRCMPIPMGQGPPFLVR